MRPNCLIIACLSLAVFQLIPTTASAAFRWPFTKAKEPEIAVASTPHLDVSRSQTPHDIRSKLSRPETPFEHRAGLLRSAVQTTLSELRSSLVRHDEISAAKSTPESKAPALMGLETYVRIYASAIIRDLNELASMLSHQPKVASEYRSLLAELMLDIRAPGSETELNSVYVTPEMLGQLNLLGGTHFTLKEIAATELPVRVSEKRAASRPSFLDDLVRRFKSEVRSLHQSTGLATELAHAGEDLLLETARWKESADATRETELKGHIAAYVQKIYEISAILEAAGDNATQVLPPEVEKSIQPLLTSAQKTLLARVKRTPPSN